MILDRYLTGEILRPLLLGLGLLILVFAGYSLSVNLVRAANGSVPMASALALTGLNTVIALEILLPTAFYFSALAALGRLHRDAEMAALYAGGVSPLRISWSVLKLAAVIALAVTFLSLQGRPWAYRESYALEAKAARKFDVDNIATGQFINLRDDYVLYAGSIDQKRGRLEHVFVKSDRGDKSEVIFAKEAVLHSTRLGAAASAEFFDGYSYLLDRTGARDVTMRYKSFLVQFPESESEARNLRKAQATGELARAKDPKDIAELQGRLTTPVASILLVLLAVPLSRSDPRQSRFRMFLGAIAVYVLVFSLIGAFRSGLEQGTIGPVPGMWTALLFPLGLWLLLLVKPRIALWLRRR